MAHDTLYISSNEDKSRPWYIEATVSGDLPGCGRIRTLREIRTEASDQGLEIKNKKS